VAWAHGPRVRAGRLVESERSQHTLRSRDQRERLIGIEAVTVIDLITFAC
jgi:hypothetical protein